MVCMFEEASGPHMQALGTAALSKQIYSCFCGLTGSCRVFLRMTQEHVLTGVTPKGLTALCQVEMPNTSAPGPIFDNRSITVSKSPLQSGI